MRRWRGWLGPLAVAALATGAGAQAGPAEQATLYEGARLIVGDGTVIEDAAFVVDGGRFARVGRRGEVGAPEGAARVDLLEPQVKVGSLTIDPDLPLYGGLIFVAVLNERSHGVS